MSFAHILTETSLTLFGPDGVVSVSSDHSNWEEIVDAVRDGQFAQAFELCSIVKQVQTYALNSGLQVTDTGIYYNGHELHSVLVDRILTMMRQGFDPKPMIGLLDNIQNNPSYRAREQLYSFLENNQLPITEDGCFMAYRAIRSDWTDHHTGTINNSVGQKVCMDRYQVDDDPTRTCSSGLHVCSLPYLKSFATGGSRLIAVKVNPADVVSVPVDYNNSKMRVCAFEVVQELPAELLRQDNDFWDAVVVSSEDDPEEDAEYEFDDEDDGYCD